MIKLNKFTKFFIKPISGRYHNPVGNNNRREAKQKLFYKKEYSILASAITSQKLLRYNDNLYKWFKRAQNCQELCDIVQPFGDTKPLLCLFFSTLPKQRTFWHAKLTKRKESKKRDVTGKGMNVCGLGEQYCATRSRGENESVATSRWDETRKREEILSLSLSFSLPLPLSLSLSLSPLL